MNVNVNDKRKAKISEENKFLREQHRKDLQKIDEMRQATAQINAAADIMIAAIVKELGEPVKDDDGTVIGYRMTMPAPHYDGSQLAVEPYEHIIGLDRTIRYRIGVVLPE